jgi:hypothetical protein
MDNLKTYFNENSYVYVPNLVSKELTTFIYNYLVLKACTNQSFSNNQDDEQEKYLRYCYGDVVTECLSSFVVEKLSQITSKKLCPTYTYTRLYTKGEILKPHSDRPSCEYSVTVNFGGDPWPIYFGDFNNEDKNLDDGYSLKKEITIQPGDGVVYMGEKLVHWRNKFSGDHCAQAFLHFIDEEGPHYPEHKYDQRKNIAYKK